MAAAREASSSPRLVVELTSRALVALVNRVTKDQATRTQAVCSALVVYDMAKETIEAGGTVILRDADGKETGLVLL